MMEGHVDQCDERAISGWCWHPDRPDEPARVEILDGDRLLATVVADGYRADLEVEGKRGGRCSFQWQLPRENLDDDWHEVHVRAADGGAELTGSPVRVVFDATRRDELAARLRATMRALAWEVEDIALEEGRVRVRGWAIPPGDGRTAGFRYDGRPFDSVELGRPSPRIGSLYWYWPGASEAGFECTLDRRTFDAVLAGGAVIEYVDESTGEPFDPGQALHWPADLLDPKAIPPDASIQRTSGHSDELLFIQHGYTSFVRLRDLLERVSGGWPEGRTLDWGSGCGRVTRWLVDAALPGVRVSGADVDAENVAWCERLLDGAEYRTIPLHPPTDYPDGSFDLVYGLSVLTHLTEDVQFEWLAELARITSPGATLLLTFHGAASVCLARPDQEWLDGWERNGFDASIEDGFLSDFIGESEYYRATFHTASYVRERWSRYFEVVEILEGFICHQQDMAVLRRR